MKNIGFIGTGEIAAALVRGLAGQGHQILVSERNATVAAGLACENHDVTIAPNAQVVAQSDIVFVCLLADTARKVLPALPWRADQVVISVMVDVPLSELAALVAPVSQISLTIPLTPVAIGGSVLPVHPDNKEMHDLFGATNTVIPVATEAGLNAHFAASALSAPLLAQMCAGAAWLANQTGDKAGAQAYVAGVFAGFLRQMEQGGSDFEDLLQGLGTEGGLNATLRDKMEAAGASRSLTDAMEALKPRLGL